MRIRHAEIPTVPQGKHFPPETGQVAQNLCNLAQDGDESDGDECNAWAPAFRGGERLASGAAAKALLPSSCARRGGSSITRSNTNQSIESRLKTASDIP